MSEPLVDKYKPKTLDDVQGHNKHLKQIQKWAMNWEQGDTPILLYGDPGIGKTTVAHALAKDMGWTTLDINASSERTQEDIQRVAERIRASTIDGERQLVVLDEIDSWDGRTSTVALRNALKDAYSPIICIGNDDWKIPDGIKNNCKTFEFKLNRASIKSRIKQIAAMEGIDISPMDIGKLSTRDNLRAAIQDLQRYSSDSEELDWDERTGDISRFKAMENMVRGKAYYGDMTPDEVVLWGTEAILQEFSGLEAAIAMDALCKADINLGRVHEQEDADYHWWRYAGELGREVSKTRITEPYDGYIRIGYPEHYRKKTKSYKDGSDEAELYQKIKKNGTYEFAGSYTYFRKVLLPFIQDMDVSVRRRLALEYNLRGNKKALKALGLDQREFEKWMGNKQDNQNSEPKDILDW